MLSNSNWFTHVLPLCIYNIVFYRESVGNWTLYCSCRRRSYENSEGENWIKLILNADTVNFKCNYDHVIHTICIFCKSSCLIFMYVSWNTITFCWCIQSKNRWRLPHSENVHKNVKIIPKIVWKINNIFEWLANFKLPSSLA